MTEMERPNNPEANNQVGCDEQVAHSAPEKPNASSETACALPNAGMQSDNGSNAESGHNRDAEKEPDLGKMTNEVRNLRSKEGKLDAGNTRPVNGTFSFTLATEWDYISKCNRNKYFRSRYALPINTRLDMEKAVNILLENNWLPYEPVTAESIYKYFGDDPSDKTPVYNEFLYFNSHMRKLIYNNGSYEADKKEAYANAVAARNDSVVVFGKVPSEDRDAYYVLKRRINGVNRYYYLPINALELRLYSVGILLLTIKCQTEKHWYAKQRMPSYYVIDPSEEKNTCEARFVVGQEDVSWIESCGRRLFAARPKGTDDSNFYAEFPAATYIIWQDEPAITICDCAEGTTAIPEKLDFLQELISKKCMSYYTFEKEMENASESKPEKFDGRLILSCFNDDRMYLHGTVISDKLVKETQAGWMARHADRTDTEWKRLEPWYAVLYGDYNWNKPTCKDRDMLIKLLEEATDPRWLNDGTVMGMTYHSMLMLVSSGAPAYLLSNNDWMYFQMFIIAVLQRCTIQRFYREASGLLQSSFIRDKHRAAVQDKYTLFLNRFWFFEVTEQEQGKQMFARLQKAMQIKEDVEFLDRALDEVNQQAENRTTTNINKLLLPLSVVGGLWAVCEMVNLLVEYFSHKQISLMDWLRSMCMASAENPAVFSEGGWAFAGRIVILLLMAGIVVCTFIYVVNQCCYLWRWLKKQLRKCSEKKIHDKANRRRRN